MKLNILKAFQLSYHMKELGIQYQFRLLYSGVQKKQYEDLLVFVVKDENTFHILIFTNTVSIMARYQHISQSKVLNYDFTLSAKFFILNETIVVS